ncbi:MAG TPA: DUF1080 domain-containing protein [Phycisphaerae bacterium]|nr:DUF1080 domain-containing protein [Phycisphaerae bacterium]HRR87238.1 DUF1080 domain-containing protein [Phycisphaerae bacterium]
MRHTLVVILGLLVMTSGCEKGGGVAPAPVEKMPTAIQLFNGRDLTGWTCDLSKEGVKMEDVWSVADGVLHCKGEPGGVLRTLDEYGDYVLSLEWRWPPGTQGGNNGVLVHTSTPRTLGIWPKSIEVQLEKGNAGDFWVIGTELDVENEQARKQGRRHLNLTDGSEKPLGEWNHMEITCKGDEVIVRVNGELVNHATNCSVTRGAICLQSEGAPIEYRNIILTPLPR